jgi:hypothetical protein
MNGGGLQDRVEFVVGASFPELKHWLGRASVGLHTMWNEHFGICIVEYMVCVCMCGYVCVCVCAFHSVCLSVFVSFSVFRTHLDT